MKVEQILELRETGRSMELYSDRFAERDLGPLIVQACDQLLALMEENLDLKSKAKNLEGHLDGLIKVAEKDEHKGFLKP